MIRFHPIKDFVRRCPRSNPWLRHNLPKNLKYLLLREHNDSPSSYTVIVSLVLLLHPNTHKAVVKIMKPCLIPTTVAAAAVILCFTMLPSSVQSLATAARPLRVAVFGGNGYVGSAVCDRLVRRGHIVTAISRRGANPKPNSDTLSLVNWVKGDATDGKVVEKALKDSDAAVHAIGACPRPKFVKRPNIIYIQTQTRTHTHAHARTRTHTL